METLYVGTTKQYNEDNIPTKNPFYAESISNLPTELNVNQDWNAFFANSLRQFWKKISMFFFYSLGLTNGLIIFA